MRKTKDLDKKIRNYELATKQLNCMVESESDLIANMAKAVSLLNEFTDWHWIGFYRVVGNPTCSWVFSRASGMHKDKLRERRLRDFLGTQNDNQRP
jgi:GAF domain-containing protein